MKTRAGAVAELARWRWIVPPPESRTHAAFQRLFLHHGVPMPIVAVECPALHTMLRMVAATRYLAVAPDTVVRHYARQRLVTEDVQDSNAVGIFAVWFNPHSDETRKSESHVTVHSMQELLAFFMSLDRKEKG